MPIHFYQKPSAEKLRTGWQTTRFWLSSWAMITGASVSVWGMERAQPLAVAAGSLSCAMVAAVYVWAISREP